MARSISWRFTFPFRVSLARSYVPLMIRDLSSAPWTCPSISKGMGAVVEKSVRRDLILLTFKVAWGC